MKTCDVISRLLNHTPKHTIEFYNKLLVKISCKILCKQKCWRWPCRMAFDGKKIKNFFIGKIIFQKPIVNGFC